MQRATEEKIQETINAVRKAQERVRFTQEDLRLRARAERLYRLMMRGHATSAEILEADFGTKNPRGLDVEYPDLDNEMVPMTEDPEFKKWDEQKQQDELKKFLGFYNEGEVFYLHPDFYDLETDPSYRLYGTSQVLPHEHIHRLQQDDFEAGFSFLPVNMQNYDLFSPIEEKGIKGKIKRLYQKFNQAAADKKMERKSLSRISDYLSKEDEIQARMHEVIATGYALWMRMPRTKIQLWAALHNMGLDTPKHIRKILHGTDEGKEALKMFHVTRPMRPYLRETTKQLNAVYDYATLPERRALLWDEAYPALYGNLLELYGDKLGRERMGLGKNPAETKKIIQQLQKGALAPDSQQISFAVASLPASQSEVLITAIINKFSEGDSNSPAAFEVIRSLLKRADVQDFLNKPRTYHRYDGGNFQNALIRALIRGHEPVIQIMAHAGINPFISNETLFAQGFYKRKTCAIDLAWTLKEKKSSLEAGEFGSQATQEAAQEWCDRIEKSLRVFARHYPDPDREENLYAGDTFIEKTTLRKELAAIGIEIPQGPATPSNASQSPGKKSL